MCIWPLFDKHLFRAQIAPLSDERVRLINDVVSSMRVIKMYTWETPFLKQVDNIRRYKYLKT